MPEDSGWIKLHRSLLESPIAQRAGLLQVWIHCLLRANYEQRRVMIPGSLVPVTVDRGEFITGQFSLYESLYPKPDSDSPTSRTVWRWLHSLEQMDCLTLRTVSSRCTVVSVCNYETYQQSEGASCQGDVKLVSSSCQAGVTPVSTDKELKNLRNKEKRAHFSRPSFQDVLAYCGERGNEIDPQAFLDYQDSVGWVVGNKPMKDWKAAVRTWEAREKKNKPQKKQRFPTMAELENWNPQTGLDG